MKKKLQGKKTYIFAGILACATFAFHTGIINIEMYDALFAIAAAGGIAALRAGVKNGK